MAVESLMRNMIPKKSHSRRKPGSTLQRLSRRISGSRLAPGMRFSLGNAVAPGRVECSDYDSRCWHTRCLRVLCVLCGEALSCFSRENSMPKLANKVALITGAAGGQGTAEAELFVREGAAVMLTDIDAAKGEALAARLSGAGARALFRVQDAASEESWREIVAATLTAFGGLHILVNNAGTIARQGIVNTTLEAWNRTLAVNLTGPLLGMKHCAPAIRSE